MRLDSRHPEFGGRNLAGTQVIDLRTGSPIRKILWADDQTGEYEAWHCDAAGRLVLFGVDGQRVGVLDEPRLGGAQLIGHGGKARWVQWDEGRYDEDARPRTYRGRTRLRFVFPYDAAVPVADIKVTAG